jgi:hypothetical protein
VPNSIVQRLNLNTTDTFTHHTIRTSRYKIRSTALRSSGEQRHEVALTRRASEASNRLGRAKFIVQYLELSRR